MSKVSAANSTAIFAGESPDVRKRGSNGFEVTGLSGGSMRNLIDVYQSSIPSEQVMNEPRYRMLKIKAAYERLIRSAAIIPQSLGAIRTALGMALASSHTPRKMPSFTDPESR
jgi:hypothetical protein